MPSQRPRANTYSILCDTARERREREAGGKVRKTLGAMQTGNGIQASGHGTRSVVCTLLVKSKHFEMSV